MIKGLRSCIRTPSLIFITIRKDLILSFANCQLIAACEKSAVKKRLSVVEKGLFNLSLTRVFGNYENKPAHEV